MVVGEIPRYLEDVPIEEGEEEGTKEEIIEIHNLATQIRTALHGNLENISPQVLEALKAVDKLEERALSQFPEIGDYIKEKAA